MLTEVRDNQNHVDRGFPVNVVIESSMLEMFTLDQSKTISLILKIENKNLKFVNCTLLFIKTEIRQVYNPF